MEVLPVRVTRGLVALGFRFDPHAPRWGFKTASDEGYKHVFVVRLLERVPGGSVGVQCYAFWDSGDSHDEQAMVYGYDAQTLVSDALWFFRGFHAWTE